MARKPAARGRPQPAIPEDEIDACDVDFANGALTADSDLPQAAGGVHETAPLGGNEDDVDACDVDFRRGLLSADADLPAATGGTAS